MGVCRGASSGSDGGGGGGRAMGRGAALGAQGRFYGLLWGAEPNRAGKRSRERLWASVRGENGFERVSTDFENSLRAPGQAWRAAPGAGLELRSTCGARLPSPPSRPPRFFWLGRRPTVLTLVGGVRLAMRAAVVCVRVRSSIGANWCILARIYGGCVRGAAGAGSANWRGLARNWHGLARWRGIFRGFGAKTGR